MILEDNPDKKSEQPFNKSINKIVDISFAHRDMEDTNILVKMARL